MQITALHIFQTKYKIWLEIMKTTLTCCVDSKPCLGACTTLCNVSLSSKIFFFISKQAWLCGESSYFWAASISTLQLGLNRN